MNHFLDNSANALEIIATWRVLVAAALGALLGIERSLSGKHAGMRTYSLVAMGSALFVVTGVLFDRWDVFGSSPDAAARIAASVVMGIGFIGSGIAFLHADKEHPGELTTAAGIWVAAGIGMAAGFGFYTLASAVTVLAIIVFTIFLRAENTLRERWGVKNGS